MNYTDRETPWTRIIEHKWFEFGKDEDGNDLPKTKAFEFLLQLKEAVCQYDSEIRERQFGRWYCITNNGVEKSVLPAAQRANESIKRLEMEFNYNKAFRVWREIDSFYENVIAIDTSLHRFVNERNTINHKVYFYGIRYGSLELPIIASMLLDIKYGVVTASSIPDIL